MQPRMGLLSHPRIGHKSHILRYEPSVLAAASIHVAAMADPQREDHHGIVEDLGQNPVVTDPVPPHAGVIGGQPFAPVAWVVQ